MTVPLLNTARYAARDLFRDSVYCARLAERLRRHEGMDPEEFERLSSRWLLRTLKAAVARLPYCGHLRVNCSERDAEEFLRERFPIIQKDDLLRNRAAHYPNEGRVYPWTLLGKTSGTTGTPLDVVRSASSVVWANAFKKRHWTWSGFRDGMRFATLRGDAVVAANRRTPPFWFHNRYNRQLILSSRHLRPDGIEALADELERFAPYLLEAYPSTAFQLAEYLQRGGRKIAIPYVYTGSEPLYAYQRELIRDRFDTVVMDHYGMAERVAYATECELGALHLNTDYSFVEIVDDLGRPTDDYGHVVGTTYHNLAMPLVRYRLSDRAKWRRGRCACGRRYPLMEPVVGKYEDTIYARSGAPVSASLVTFVFKEMRHIARSQVAQVGDGHWEVRIVPTPGFTAFDKEQLVQRFHATIDPDLRIDVVTVEDIPRTATGKFRWVVNEHRNGGRTNTVSRISP